MLPDCLSFLKSSDCSPGIREILGPDMVVDLRNDDISKVPEIPGAYIIVSTDGTFFQYPNGKSRVMYIGMSNKLQSRIKTHADSTRHIEKRLDEYSKMSCQCQQRYHYFRTFGAKVYIFTHRGRQLSKSQEAIYLGKFYERYLSLPVCNGARSFS